MMVHIHCIMYVYICSNVYLSVHDVYGKLLPKIEFSRRAAQLTFLKHVPAHSKSYSRSQRSKTFVIEVFARFGSKCDVI